MVDLNDALFTRGYRSSTTSPRATCTAMNRRCRAGRAPARPTSSSRASRRRTATFSSSTTSRAAARSPAGRELLDERCSSRASSATRRQVRRERPDVGRVERAGKPREEQAAHRQVLHDRLGQRRPRSITITDGTDDKSNDCQMLIDWMKLSEHRCGLWVCGDDVASDLDDLGRRRRSPS